LNPRYSNFQLSKSELVGNSDSLQITVAVKNTGNREGKEVILLFTRDEYASITPSVKRLKRSTKVSLAPSETKIISFYIGANDLGFVQENNTWITEPGEFTAMINGFSKPFNYKK